MSNPGSAPNLAGKLHYKVSEVCQLTDTQPYVLKFWEQEFPQLAPEKSPSGQRLYRKQDIDLVQRIKHLLYEKEFTITAVRRALETGEIGLEPPAAIEAPRAGQASPGEMPAERGDVRADLSGLLFDRDEATPGTGRVAQGTTPPAGAVLSALREERDRFAREVEILRGKLLRARNEVRDVIRQLRSSPRDH